ncbi:hypothetical protein T265_03728 [Opisthorchis viverrini]|uniref:Uncharacterized protein n=1 Tax=Opisthorchis viverrini TaxID=6198 RepID=A0A074ZRK7_OPIVI|nr:hypothetical protein T265_03728 [Opisthorchis viverrini]KER29711.1 hypothetical protein T265_03728 [Opisthorchis viverrini]
MPLDECVKLIEKISSMSGKVSRFPSAKRCFSQIMPAESSKGTVYARHQSKHPSGILKTPASATQTLACEVRDEFVNRSPKVHRNLHVIEPIKKDILMRFLCIRDVDVDISVTLTPNTYSSDGI